ncbi:MAG: hypothetical protein K2N09_09445 [Muribaculaceae bacterium]|nr:hypothetical protein [Muribaculaceae bacterium]
MRKLLLFGFMLGFVGYSHAQGFAENATIIDQAEDTTQVYTINDIIVMQEMVNTRNATDAHIAKVWSRKSYFNPGYVSSKLSSKGDVPLNSSKSLPLEFESKWGAQIELGHSYTLHKGAIANMVQINLDYTFIDLTVNHYKEDTKIYKEFETVNGGGTTSGNRPSNNNTQSDYLPWGADKYDLTYGMSLGPSITIAPFTMLNAEALHFFKLNAYCHYGYNIGMMLMDHKDNADKKGLSFDYPAWGHGSSLSFGLCLSWKSIGIGWETRSTSLKYKALSPGENGDLSYKFKNSSSRIYLSIRY